MKTQIITVVCAIVANIALAQTNTAASGIKKMSDKDKTYVTYSMSHTLHDWEGTSHAVASVIMLNDKNEITSVATIIKIASFDSQNANRDSHAIEVLDAIKIPSVSFTSQSIKTVGNDLEVTGFLSFHNVKKLITFKAVKSDDAGLIKVVGNFSIKMTDYNVEPPSLMGMATQDEIKLNFTAEYK